MSENVVEFLSPVEQQTLLALARQSITAAAMGQAAPQLCLDELPECLRVPRACFVTLHLRETGELRGCTGVLRAVLPLAEEIVRTAAQTAACDPRFNPVTPAELPDIAIEISLLTPARPLAFECADDLPRLLRPGVDGVTLVYRGQRQATFLPQVWGKIPDPVEFLSRLCLKMGLPGNAWRWPEIEVEIYEVQEFAESERAES